MTTQQQEQISFPNQDLERIIQETVEQILSTRIYEQSQVPNWINEVCENVMEKLVYTQKPFKYLVNCLIMQRKGANVVVSNSMYWDTSLDSLCTVIWPKEKANKAQLSKNTIQCMVSVFAMSTLNGNIEAKNDI